MSFKKKLLISLGCFSLIAAITVVAVFAAVQQAVNISSSVTFTAKNVNATVSLSTLGAVSDQTVSHTFAATDAASTQPKTLPAVAFKQDPAVTTNNQVDPIKYTFTITNKDTVNSLKAVITVTDPAGDLKPTTTDGGTTVATGTTLTIVKATSSTSGSSQTYSFWLDYPVTNIASNISGSISMSVTLTAVTPA